MKKLLLTLLAAAVTLAAAAGGISSIEDAEHFIQLGAERLGTSRIVKIAKALEEAQPKE